MVNQQLLDYIKQRLQQGVSQEQIKGSLMANNWQEADIKEAFASIDSPNLQSLPNSMPSQQFSASPQQLERKTNKTLLAVISIISVLIIGGGILGYFLYFRETPEKVIEKMIARLTDVKTFEYKGELKVEIAAPDLLGNGGFTQPTQPTSSKQLSNFFINFSGKSDISDLSNPKGSFIFNIKTDALKELTQTESVFGLEVRTINQVIYLKLSNLPDLGFFDLGFLTDQWIKIDVKEFEEQIKEEEKQWKLSPEQIEQIEKIAAKSKIFRVTEKLPSEKIEGMDTHRYKFLIDETKLKKLVVDINTVVQNKTLTEKELAEFNKSLEEIESINGEIWIGKKDYFPYKILFMIKEKETVKSKTAGQLIITSSFKNYNKPVQVDIPSPVKNIEEILGPLFSEFLGGMQLPNSQPHLQLPVR